MKNIKKVLGNAAIAFLGGFLALYIYVNYINRPEVSTIQHTIDTPAQFASMSTPPPGELPDLTYAAEKSVHAVVHIQTETQREGYARGGSLYDFFFGNPYRQYPQEPQIQRGSGSGVIISDDGFIVTNNHVINGADKIKVVLNDNREYEASLIGTDPSTDVALLKIESKEKLKFLTFGSSDNLKLGEWVLAVGNPFNLTSTVTAGIVSAKSRNINIIQGSQNQIPIESFIQTDAAVNPGNSGGALVNMRGELVGINTAIASQTGSYSGYSFAVPVTIVQKVVADLKEFGIVQRALLGIMYREVTADFAKENDLDKIEGVYVAEVTEDGGADEAGIEKGDVLIAINGNAINSGAQLKEQISQFRPGDKVNVLVKRDNKKKQFTVTLRNTHGNTEIAKNTVEVLGAKIKEITYEEKAKLGIRNGVRIVEIGKGQLKDAGIREGFIIVEVNKTRINSNEDFVSIIKKVTGGVLVEGIYPNGEPAYYVFSVDR
ncbi:Do family serine endopeptidase [Puteibacter caeruleilacunae]|nr:Do family serine endopeptidase [Puteibacter caeruleilacunae]